VTEISRFCGFGGGSGVFCGLGAVGVAEGPASVAEGVVVAGVPQAPSNKAINTNSLMGVDMVYLLANQLRTYL
jgi:hypothetical protein